MLVSKCVQTHYHGGVYMYVPPEAINTSIAGTMGIHTYVHYVCSTYVSAYRINQPPLGPVKVLVKEVASLLGWICIGRLVVLNPH